MTNTFKEIILPIAQICSTLLVGGALAFYLNRRTNRDKIKGLLIDSYMEYLVLYKNFYISELNTFSKIIYTKILRDKAYHLSLSIEQKIEKVIKEKKEKYDDRWIEENANISFSTYKFAFLLGKKKYSQKLQHLEDMWTRHLQSFEKRQNLVKKITDKINIDGEIKKWSGTENTSSYMIRSEEIIEQTLNEEMFKDFLSYNDAVAEEIDKY